MRVFYQPVVSILSSLIILLVGISSNLQCHSRFHGSSRRCLSRHRNAGWTRQFLGRPEQGVDYPKAQQEFHLPCIEPSKTGVSFPTGARPDVFAMGESVR